MNVIQELRWKKLCKVLQDNELTPPDFAVIIGKSASYAAQLVSRTNPCPMGYDMARHIEKCLQLKAGYLDENKQKLDLKILHLVINKLEAALIKRKIRLNPTEKAELISYLYELKTGNKMISDYKLRKIINEQIS